jgi:tetratricopeptide (TPR) repeat protein
MAGHLYVAGDNAGAVSWGGRAMSLADELGLDDEAVLALQYRGAARAQLGDPNGIEDLREALRRALDLGLGNETAVTYNNLALQLWSWEGPEAAKAVWDEMIEFCRARGFRTLAIWAESGALESLFDLGEWDRVLATGEQMLAWDREHGPTRVAATALIYVAWVHLRRGDLERAEAAAAELLPRTREIGYAEFLGPALVISAEVAVARGRAAEAIELAEEFASLTEDELDYRTLFLPLVARQLVAAGAVDRAEALVASTPDRPSAWRVGLSAITARAVVAEARGDFGGALERYREAAVGWGEYRFGLECGRSTIAVGRCLLALGRDREAVRALTEAKAILASLGARAFVAEADDLLARAVAASS